MIFECVGQEKCIDGRKLYLVYDKPDQRPFAPQWKLTADQLERRVDLAIAEGCDVTIYGECNGQM